MAFSRISVCVALVCALSLARACTYVELRLPSNNVVVARSMEFPFPGILAEDWRLTSHPRSKRAAQGEVSFDRYGRIDWFESNPYGFVSIDGVFKAPSDPANPENLDVLHVLSGDGMNEYGLTVSAHSFASAGYQPVDESKRNVFYFYFVAWALGNFKNADDLVYALRTNVSMIAPIPIFSLAKFHWGVTDAYGRSYVIEYTQGDLHVYNNSQVGVMTNDPVWPWHVENLNTYSTVSPLWSDGGTKLAIDSPFGKLPSEINNGYNLFGLPGDFTPQSRFARMWYMKQILLFNRKKPISTVDEAIVVGTALINSVFIPKGTLASELESELDERLVRDQDFTQYNVMKVPHQQVYMFRSYENMQWKRVHLNNVDFSVGAKPISIDVYDNSLGIQDLI